MFTPDLDLSMKVSIVILIQCLVRRNYVHVIKSCLSLLRRNGLYVVGVCVASQLVEPPPASSVGSHAYAVGIIGFGPCHLLRLYLDAGLLQ